MSSTSSTQLQPPPVAMSTEDDRALTYEVLTTARDKADALKLVIDSVAQQRQVASRDVIFHSLSVSVLVGVLAVAYVAMDAAGNDFIAMTITFCGIVLIYLSVIRYAASAYIRVAEETDWTSWLDDQDDNETLILGARYGAEIIATVFLLLPKRNTRAKATQTPKASIRAWTTRLRYRRHGLGGDMLREAVKASKQSQGLQCIVEFADDHANSTVALYPVFNGPFESRQAQATSALSAAVKQWEAEESSQR
ncbi:hypothetical protein B0J13DRAFT_138377 [Dactylonectria estremocensis]|uniref:N-acetyltransferase domain-containing protein n=1 Tax=Dactylonectria estremocensis TaxID=1079267 RepID=A0A9P9INT7_9HYPO|nr:hypothetical protein B0J13DRAFT_138377 [Dactylonectria estremocensis]